MSARLDLAAYNRDEQLTLVVEVKKKQAASPDWVAQLRRNLLAHDNLPNSPFFLLALPDRFYLWKNNGKSDSAGKPNYTVDATPILRPYLERTGIKLDQVSGQSLELILASWLSELLHKKPNEFDASERWLVESGLYDAVAGGRLAYGVVA